MALLGSKMAQISVVAFPIYVEVLVKHVGLLRVYCAWYFSIKKISAKVLAVESL